jgi:hypothetical protein
MDNSPSATRKQCSKIGYVNNFRPMLIVSGTYVTYGVWLLNRWELFSIPTWLLAEEDVIYCHV